MSTNNPGPAPQQPYQPQQPLSNDQAHGSYQQGAHMGPQFHAPVPNPYTQPYNQVPSVMPGPQMPMGQAYPPPTSPYMTPRRGSWNAMSIVGFICSFFFAPAGLVLSIIAWRQIKRTGEESKALAIAGTIISAFSLVVSAVLIFFVFFFALIAGNIDTDYANRYCETHDCYSDNNYGDDDDYSFEDDKFTRFERRKSPREEELVAWTCSPVNSWSDLTISAA
ncbi:hypothetical protein CRD60_07125 [Bifidobacterium aemilianum]|uniref:DUF4190 domain-containing protein n=1 Tax=Bifidobacterium aemilianum TaxID=2493120 RepID=A0A366K7U6_9BIFI|nr:DUF4190 domain-containing protein [Bifidobacterium aemilianum]RBP97387.1 hypothetical protein CRD60_07125 [Bifidobacterium aemilianum]